MHVISNNRAVALFWMVALTLLFWMGASNSAQAASAVKVSRGGYSAPSVALNQSRLVNLAEKPGRVSVGNPDIADLLVLDDGQVYVVGKALGQTNIQAWTANNRPLASLDIEVTHDLNRLKRKLYEVLPDETIAVRGSGKDIVLSGEVSDVVRMDTAIRIADSFAKTADQEAKAISLLSVGGARQVMLEVKVAEVQRNHLKRLGINFNSLVNNGSWSFGGVNGGASFPNLQPVGANAGDVIPLLQPADSNGAVDSGIFGPPLSLFQPNPVTIPASGLFGSLMTGGSLFNLYIDAAKDNDIARILAEPTLTTMSGMDAKFIAGGEFPIPVNSGDDEITVDYKEYGVGLEFLPLVLNSGRINLKLNVTVSELVNRNATTLGNSASNAVLVVPALTKRSAQSTVELKDGQTIAIAGLVNENMRDVLNKFPGLGDVPVLGYLFRSQQFQKGQTELVIMVTPRLAKPLDNPAPTLPTDTFVEPDDREFYLLGMHDIKKAEEYISRPGQPVQGTTGTYGHDLGSVTP